MGVGVAARLGLQIHWPEQRAEVMMAAVAAVELPGRALGQKVAVACDMSHLRSWAL